MKRLIVTLSFQLGMLLPAVAQSGPDSLAHKKPATTWRVTTRLHTLGYFSYSGRINSPNPAADVNFTAERNGWGATVVKVADLQDHHTDNNFTFLLLYRNFKLGKRLTITPNLASFLEQKHSAVDRDSDVSILLLTSYRISPRLTLDHTAIFTNLVFNRTDTDWINRLRLLYSHRHIDVTLLAWQNNRVIDPTMYYSGGLSVFYSRVPVTDHFHLSLGVTGVKMPYSSHPEEFPAKDGVLLSLVGVFH